MPLRKPQPEVAFLAAALALLGAPVLMLAGLIAFGLAAHVLTPLDRLNGPASSLVMLFFFAWAVLVVAVVLILGVRLSRRVTRQ